ncbi:MAG: hypothetical protein WD097_05445 [Balneolales bacterium]
MGKRTAKYSRSDIKNLPDNKPASYKIKTESGKTNYTGTAKRGRVRDRISEHLGEIPGAKVEIQQHSSIQEAQRQEKNIISRSKPKYNKT